MRVFGSRLRQVANSSCRTRRLRSFVPASSPAIGAALVLGPQTLRLAVVEQEARVVEQARHAEAKRASADLALEHARDARERVEGDGDRHAADLVVHDLVILEDGQEIGARVARDRDADDGRLGRDGVRRLDAREGRCIDRLDAVATRATGQDPRLVDERLRDREPVEPLRIALLRKRRLGGGRRRRRLRGCGERREIAIANGSAKRCLIGILTLRHPRRPRRSPRRSRAAARDRRRGC